MAGASWVYQGLPGEPHALLTSGLHSDGYFNVNAVTQFPNLCKNLAGKLINRSMLDWLGSKDVDVVVSSSFAAITFGAEVAGQLDAMFVFTEKNGKDQIWTGRFELPAGVQVLQVEDLITTLSTTKKVKEAVSKANPEIEFLENNGKTLVATVVHRPVKLSEYPDYEVIPLMELEIHNWESGECPLCEEGSYALRPKPSWQEFQRYMEMKKK